MFLRILIVAFDSADELSSGFPGLCERNQASKSPYEIRVPSTHELAGEVILRQPPALFLFFCDAPSTWTEVGCNAATCRSGRVRDAFSFPKSRSGHCTVAFTFYIMSLCLAIYCDSKHLALYYFIFTFLILNLLQNTTYSSNFECL